MHRAVKLWHSHLYCTKFIHFNVTFVPPFQLHLTHLITQKRGSALYLNTHTFLSPILLYAFFPIHKPTLFFRLFFICIFSNTYKSFSYPTCIYLFIYNFLWKTLGEWKFEGLYHIILSSYRKAEQQVQILTVTVSKLDNLEFRPKTIWVDYSFVVHALRS